LIHSQIRSFAMKPISSRTLLLFTLLFSFSVFPLTTTSCAESKNEKTSSDDTLKIAEAFKNKKSDLQVRATGKVIKTLPDDTKGSKHQRFILVLSNGQTLLIAHNIDLAPRVPGLKKGDSVEFYGEYEWNPKGGVIHWTHHDPKKKHVDGWLKFQGKVYK